jgi:hypothetical protein
LLGIGIEADAAAIGIRHLKPVQEHSGTYQIPLFLYWTGSGIGILFLSGTGLTGCLIV